MKPCEAFLDDIFLSLDGQLSDEEEAALQVHLAACPSCRQLYDTYRNIDAAVMEMAEEPPEGLHQAVMNSIRHEKERNKPFAFLKRGKFTLIAAVAAVVLLLVGRNVDLSFSGENSSDAGSAAAEAAAEAPVEEAAEAEAPDAPEPAAGQNAQLLPGYSFSGNAGETTAEDATEEQYEEEGTLTEGAMDAPESAPASEGSAYSIREVFDMLHQDGYAGDLYQLAMTEEEFLDVAPSCQRLRLSSGLTIYRTIGLPTFKDLLQIVDSMEEENGRPDYTYYFFTP